MIVIVRESILPYVLVQRYTILIWINVEMTPCRLRSLCILMMAPQPQALGTSMWSRSLYLVHSPTNIQGQVTQLQTHSAGPKML